MLRRASCFQTNTSVELKGGNVLTDVQAILVRIRAKQAERDHLLREPDLWAAVQAQGIAIDSVDCWGFEPEWLTPKQRPRNIEPFDLASLTRTPANGWQTATIVPMSSIAGTSICRAAPQYSC